MVNAASGYPDNRGMHKRSVKPGCRLSLEVQQELLSGVFFLKLEGNCEDVFSFLLITCGFLQCCSSRWHQGLAAVPSLQPLGSGLP